MKTINTLATALILLAACGDNKTRPDARPRDDGPPGDAQCSNCPAAPTLGTQIDRMGRPAINTALTRGFDSTAGAATAKDAYNQDADPAGWGTPAKVGEFMKNLAIIDALDFGFCGNGLCEVGEDATSCPGECTVAGTVTTSCGNQALYNGTGGGQPMATSYGTLATILTGDELFLDTSNTTCVRYLAVEFAAAIGGPDGVPMTCGGRAPNYDVIDFTLSFAAMGVAGFSTDGMFTPKLTDGVPAHTDYLPTFPYLGAPH